jgi:hypothetical protein
MTTFNMTANRTTALDALVVTAADADRAADALDNAVNTAIKAGFTKAHFASRGKGGAGEPGAAFDAAMTLAAAALLNDADQTIWSGPKSKDRTAISNRLSNWVARLAKRLAAANAGEATGAKAKGSKKAPLARDRDAIAARRNYLTTAVQQKTDVQKAAVAAYGGEAKAKEYLAAWDTIAAVYK